MKILRIIASVDPSGGGPIEGLLQQAEVMTRQGTETHVASLDDPAAEWVRTCPVQVFALGKKRRDDWRRRLPWVHYGYSPAFVPWLKVHVKEYDVVLVDGLWNYATMGARRVLVTGSVSYAVFTHGMLDPWFRKTYPLKNVLKQSYT